MKLLLMFFIIGLSLVAIFLGSKDAAQRKEDYEKYGGDALIKAISEYNEKSNSLHGPVGGIGVTRTPLTASQDQSGPFGKHKSYKMPKYMMTRPGSVSPDDSRYYPPNPYAPKKRRYQQNSTDSEDSDAGNRYYPPPPLEESSPSQTGSGYPPQSHNHKEYIIPMTLPPQAWPQKAMHLRSGQRIGFAGTSIYTYDKNGNPIALPDGYYKIGELRLHVIDGKKVINE